MRRFVLILMAIACMGIMGCGGTKHMQPVDPAGMSAIYDTVNPDEAVIVFFRPWSVAGQMYNPALVEADESGNLSFVAVMSNGTKYHHRTTPGKHQYFRSAQSIGGGLVSCILAGDLEGGKTYYVHAFDGPELTPVMASSNDALIKDLNSCDWVEATPTAQNWFNDNLPSLKNKYTQARGKGVILIKPEYGTATPVR